MGRLHGRPLDVIPRHVEFGFLESARSSSDSGVLATKGMMNGPFDVQSRRYLDIGSCKKRKEGLLAVF